jgi:hypothetical protein
LTGYLKYKNFLFLTGQIPPLLNTHRVFCAVRIYSVIPPIDNEQWSTLSPGEKLKLSWSSHRMEPKRNCWIIIIFKSLFRLIRCTDTFVWNLTRERCLTYAITRRAHWPRRHRGPHDNCLRTNCLILIMVGLVYVMKCE